MNVIQGGPKPIVAAAPETLTHAAGTRDVAPTTVVHAVPKAESTAHYAREGRRDQNVDDVRGRRVDVEA